MPWEEAGSCEDDAFSPAQGTVGAGLAPAPGVAGLLGDACREHIYNKREPRRFCRDVSAGKVLPGRFCRDGSARTVLPGRLCWDGSAGTRCRTADVLRMRP